MEPSFSSLAKRFSPRLNLVLINAAKLAASQGKKAINPTHLLYSIASQQEFLVAQFFGKDMPNTPSPKIKTTKSAATKKKSAKKEDDAIALNPASQKVLHYAHKLAQHYHHTTIDTLHLFASLLHHPPTDLKAALKKRDMDTDELETQMLGWLEDLPALSTLVDSLMPTGDAPRTASSRSQKQTALQAFAEHLTDPAYATKLDPLIGREQELAHTMRILARRTKNNPVLIGEPGVGKTAIVEGLAKKILLGDVPDLLRDKKLYALNITAMIAGSTFRGELEARFKALIDEVIARQDVILFIDEIHTIVGAGSSPGSLDIGNILKPALARGQLRCIGATTYTEYKKHIEDDPALERRFQAVPVEPPSLAQTEYILTGLAPHYAQYHGVTITPEAIKSAVAMSHRYLPEKMFPDKAIDLLDEAAAKLRIDTPTLTIETDTPHTPPVRILTPQTIAEVIAHATGIPTEHILETPSQALATLELAFDDAIVSQKEAKKSIARAVRRAKSGLTSSTRPRASFAFVGPSGVGKTELAKTLAREVFGHEGFIKLDMSEFSESFTISRLIGAPSGYVGFKEGGKLTEAVRRHPHSLILFDEIEKAHPKVANILLQILEDGYLTDAAGKKIDFSQSMIILTSNLGAKHAHQSNALGFGEHTTYNEEDARARFIKELEDHLSPELINRLDHVIVFHPLTAEHLKEIIDRKLQDVRERLATQGIQLLTTARAQEHLVSKVGIHTTQGARKVRSVIEQEVEGLIADTLLASEARPSVLSLDYTRGTLACTPSRARTRTTSHRA